MKNRNHAQSGFSLVEVTLALGVVVFCLVTILGLLAVGVNTTHVSTVQTAATNILTAVSSDLESTPNYTPSYPTHPTKGTIGTITSPQVSSIYGIAVPPGGAGQTIATQTTTPAASLSKPPIYIGENGQVVTTAAAALYQLNYWIVASNTSTAKQETFARLLITWPAVAPINSAQGYVENVIAINRT